VRRKSLSHEEEESGTDDGVPHAEAD